MSAGDIVYAADFGTPAGDSEGTDETGFTSTSYTAGATPCGVAFVAPTGGQVLILWGVRLECNTASPVRCHASISVRTGGTLGSGTVVSATDDNSSIETPTDATGGSNTRIQASRHRRVTGLTPGDTYNVQIEHKMSAAGNGDIFYRDVDVFPIAVG